MNATNQHDTPTQKRRSWKVVYQGLKAQIEEGKRPVGSPCPTEHELSQTYGVARGTVRNALSRLWKEGYLEFLPGRGRTVSRPEPVRLTRVLLHKFAHELSFGKHLADLSEAEAGGWTPTDEVLAGPELCAWYTLGNEARLDVAVIKQRLNLAGDEAVCWFLRARYARGNPLVLQWAVVPATFLTRKPLRIDDLRPGGLTKLYRANGIYRSRAHAIYRPTSASRDEAQHLRLEKGTPLIEESRTSFFDCEETGELTPYEWLVTLYTDRVELGFDWEDEKEPPREDRSDSETQRKRRNRTSRRAQARG